MLPTLTIGDKIFKILDNLMKMISHGRNVKMYGRMGPKA
jgi:hypothetical protein